MISATGMPKTIYSVWLQGLEAAPDLVRFNFGRWVALTAGVDVVGVVGNGGGVVDSGVVVVVDDAATALDGGKAMTSVAIRAAASRESLINPRNCREARGMSDAGQLSGLLPDSLPS